MRFTPAKVSGSVASTGNFTVQVAGSLTVHGPGHQIVVPMQIQVAQGGVTATGKFMVLYAQWGTKNPSNFLLKAGDQAEIELTAAARMVVQGGQ